MDDIGLKGEQKYWIQKSANFEWLTAKIQANTQQFVTFLQINIELLMLLSLRSHVSRIKISISNYNLIFWLRASELFTHVLSFFFFAHVVNCIPPNLQRFTSFFALLLFFVSLRFLSLFVKRTERKWSRKVRQAVRSRLNCFNLMEMIRLDEFSGRCRCARVFLNKMNPFARHHPPTQPSASQETAGVRAQTKKKHNKLSLWLSCKIIEKKNNTPITTARQATSKSNLLLTPNVELRPLWVPTNQSFIFMRIRRMAVVDLNLHVENVGKF